MKRIFFYAIFIIACIIFQVGVSRAASQPVMEAETRLLQLINEARANPAGMAASVGLKPQGVLSNHPELAEIFKEGLPPVSLEEHLQGTAYAHCAEMADAGYYDYFSLDGLSPEQRVIASGYKPGGVRESLGAITFNNYLPVDQAAWSLFYNMYVHELTADTEDLAILNPQAEDIGICVMPARLTIQGKVYNTYLATCDFAWSRISRFSLMLFGLINEARAHPLDMAVAIGMDKAEVLEALPGMKDVLLSGLPPVAWNDKLFDSCYEHAWDMLKRGYYSPVSPEGETLEERLVRHGYVPVLSGETMRLIMDDEPMGPEQAAWVVFKEMFKRELSPGWPDRHILNPSFREMGTCFVQANPEDMEGTGSNFAPYYNSLGVADFGAREIDEGPWICGRVYRDRDSNGLYSPGEGVSGARVLIVGEDVKEELYTDESGAFEIAVAPGTYSVCLYNEGECTGERQVIVEDQNGDVSFALPGD